MRIDDWFFIACLISLRDFLISDWLMPSDETARWLRSIRGQGVTAFVLAVLDPAEVELPYSGHVRFKGLEDEGLALIGNVDRVRSDYAALLAQHRDTLADTSRRLGFRMTWHQTDHSPAAALLPVYMALGAGEPR